MNVYDGTDACVSPVCTLSEAKTSPHYVSRGTFVDVDGSMQPQGVPRFSRTPNRPPQAAPKLGEHGVGLLREFGISDEHIEVLLEKGILRSP